MKTLFKIGAIFFLLAIYQSCIDDESATNSSLSSGTRFSFSLENADEESYSEFYATVTIEDQDGTRLMEDHPLHFRNENGKFVTDGLDLPPGEYTLTDFSVATDGEVLFQPGDKEHNAQGSNALPISFKVSSEKNAPLNLQTLKACVGKNKFRLAVSVSEGDKNKLTAATAHIMKDGQILRTYDLKAKVNNLSFDLDPKGVYSMVIVKRGHAQFTQQFIFAEASHKVLRCTLMPAFTMMAVPNVNRDNTFEVFLLGAEESSINVDWGDGTSESITSPVLGVFNLAKAYASSDIRYVVITGDIDQITYFNSYYGNGLINEIDFAALTGLKEIAYGLTAGPKEIDLSYNINLEVIGFVDVKELEVLILPTVHHIRLVELYGYNAMAGPAVDYVINSVYTNAIAHSITGGFIGVKGHWYLDDPLFIGPPSATGLAQLSYLRDMLGWGVKPVF